jgi:hypothetical protein
MNRLVSTASCLALALCTTAFAANSSSNWKAGVVREVDNSRARVTVANFHHNDPGLKGHGVTTQYCTVEVENQIVVGEREVRDKFDRASVFVGENADIRLDGDSMTMKDSHGNQVRFHVISAMPDSLENEPDPTAFAETPLVIQ